MKCLLIYPEIPETFWSFKHALKFLKIKASNPPLGLVTVAAMLPDSWELKLVDMNVDVLRQKHLDWADMVMVSAMSIQRKSSHKLIERCKQAGKMVVAGGPLFTQEYEAFPKVDHFVLNEAEITLSHFLRDLEMGSPKRVYASEEYANLQETPIPRWDLLKLNNYESLSIQYTRGCPFNCDFCNVTALLGHKVRYKTTRQIMEELDLIYSLGWRRNIFFVDDNFIGNKKELKNNLLPALINWRRGRKGCAFLTEASINLADDEDLMNMMYRAGFASVFIGIETPDEESLEECRKKQNVNRNLEESVRIIQRAGIQVMGGFIVGFDKDKPSIFQRQIDFIQNSGIVTAMVGLLQAPLGTSLYQRLKKEGRINEEFSGDNTDGSTNIIPKMDIEILKRGYRMILDSIYSAKPFYERVRTFLKEYKLPRIKNPLQTADLRAFFRSIYWIGVRSKDRLHYWRLLAWTLLTRPKKFQLAITCAIYGHHFKEVSQLNGM